MKITSAIFIILSGVLQCQAQVISQSKKLFESRHFIEAKKLLNGVREKSADFADAQYLLGRIAVEEKDYDESVRRFENAIEVNPRCAEYHNWLGVMYGVQAMNAGTVRQAYLAPKIKTEFETAAEIDPDNLQTQWGLVNYYCKAPGFLGGSWGKALASASLIEKHDPAQGARAFGFVHAAQKKNDIAEQEFIKATKLNPNDVENDYALAQFYVDQRKFEKALALYQTLIKKDPGNMVAAFHFGHAVAQTTRNYDEGIACLNKYLIYTPKPNEPSLSGANVDLATIYEKKGDRVRARSYYLSALKMQPGMKEAKEGLSRVD